MAMGTPLRLVLDTNILVRGLLNQKSYSARVLHACEQRRFIPLLSKALLKEYRYILADSELLEHYPILDPRRVRTVLERLSYVGDTIRSVPKRFTFPRDPQDAKLIDLAITGRATHLITTDKDILELSDSWSETGKSLRRNAPSLVIATPGDFAATHLAL